MPPINNKINERFVKNDKTIKALKIIAELVFFFIILLNVPTSEDAIQNKNNNAENTAVLQIASNGSSILDNNVNNTIENNESSNDKNDNINNNQSTTEQKTSSQVAICRKLTQIKNQLQHH